MNKEAVAQKIIQLYEDENGLYVQLHGGFFNEELHMLMFKLLDEYAVLLGKDEMISRSVAGCLFDHTQLLEGVAYQFRLNKSPDEAKLSKGHADILALTYKLLR